MKKVNKTILFASTLFISSIFAGANHSYAQEDYKLDDSLTQAQNKESSDSDSTKENNQEPVNYDYEGLEKALNEIESDKASDGKGEIESTKAINKEEQNLPTQEEISIKEISGDKGPKDAKNTNYQDIVYYDNSKLDEIYKEAKTKPQKANLPSSSRGASKEERQASKTNWYEENSKVYHKDDKGSLSKGLSEIEGKKYYFDKDGVLQTNKKIITNNSYYEANDRGILSQKPNSWVNVNKKVYRTDNKGNILKGISKIGKDLYNFSNEGVLQANIKEIKDDMIYMTDKLGKISNPKNFWANIGGKTYRTGKDGKILTGANNIEGKTYVFDKYGVMVKNKGIMSQGRFYNTDSRGVANNPKNAWINFNGKKYHTNANGYVQEGVWKIDGKLYYFTSNGLQGNTEVVQQGVVYKVDANGIAKPVDNNIDGEKNLDKVIEWMLTARKAGLRYDMHWKNRVSDKAADCSSAVYRSLIYGGFLKQGSYIGNTETLFKMGRERKIMYEVKESEIRYGDIFVAGTPGESSGAGGHTGFILNRSNDTIIHMSYGQDGVAITPRKGYMGDGSGLPVRYYRLIGAGSNNLYESEK